MTKKSEIRLVKDQANEIAKKAFAEMATKMQKTPIDNSPTLDPLLFRDLVEKVSALNLGNLAHEMTALGSELPLLIERCDGRPADKDYEGFLMAVAFESGRRYNLLQVFSTLSEEVEALEADPIATTADKVFQM